MENNVTQAENHKSRLPPWFIGFAFAVMVVLFGVRFIAIPLSNEGAGPFWGGALRLMLAVAILLLFMLIRKPTVPNARDIMFTVTYGVFGVGFNIGLMYWGLMGVNSDIAAIVYASVPLMVITLSICLGLERFHIRLLTGAMFGLWGVEVIFGVAIGFGANLTSLLAIISGAFFNAIGMLAAKKAFHVDTILMNSVGFTVGAVVLLCMAFLTGESFSLPTQQSTWLAIGFLVAVSVVGYSLNVYIIQQKSVSYASFSNVLTPLVTFAASSAFLGEGITPAFIVGAGLIFAGLFFSGHLSLKKKNR